MDMCTSPWGIFPRSFTHGTKTVSCSCPHFFTDLHRILLRSLDSGSDYTIVVRDTSSDAEHVSEPFTIIGDPDSNIEITAPDGYVCASFVGLCCPRILLRVSDEPYLFSSFQKSNHFCFGGRGNMAKYSLAGPVFCVFDGYLASGCALVPPHTSGLGVRV